MKLFKITFSIALFLIMFFGKVFSQNKNPNVVFILIDDLGYGDLANYGHLIAKTPNIDKFAKQGIKFTDFYSPSPLCSPSRASMLTGRTPYRLGIQSWIPEGDNVYLRQQEVTMANILKNNGYQCFLSGKWHLNGGLNEKSHSQPQDSGFDRWMALHAFAIPNHKDPVNFFEDGKPLGKLEGYSGTIAVDKAIQYLEERDKNQPFFLYLPMNEVHGQIASPAKFLKKYNKYIREDVNLAILKDNGPGEYYANITFMDYEIGRILKYLENNCLDKNTIVLFASDNGPVTSQWRKFYEINLHGSTGGFRGRKADLFDGGIHVPAIIRYPKEIKSGIICSEPVHGYDLFPTLFSMLKIPIPKDREIDGMDISPLFKENAISRNKPLFWAFETRSADDPEGFFYAARDGDWKIITDFEVKKVKLYNLKIDRFEVNEVSKTNPKIAEKLKSYILEMKMSIEKDPLRPKDVSAPNME
jgi:arylsulfatase A-like enzyme